MKMLYIDVDTLVPLNSDNVEGIAKKLKQLYPEHTKLIMGTNIDKLDTYVLMVFKHLYGYTVDYIPRINDTIVTSASMVLAITNGIMSGQITEDVVIFSPSPNVHVLHPLATSRNIHLTISNDL